MQYLSEGYYPVSAPRSEAGTWNGKIARDSWSELVEACRTGSLCEVAKRYGVSHEAVRWTLWQARGGLVKKER
jgi:hypothetical protein